MRKRYGRDNRGDELLMLKATEGGRVVKRVVPHEVNRKIKKRKRVLEDPKMFKWME